MFFSINFISIRFISYLSASDHLLGISRFSEQTDVTKSSINLTLSGADQTFISLVLNENVINDTVTIYRGLLDDDNTIIADPFLLYKGSIENFEIQEQQNQVHYHYLSYLIGQTLNKKNGRKTNNTSQQRFFSTDVGMDFSSQTVQDIKWGRA